MWRIAEHTCRREAIALCRQMWDSHAFPHMFEIALLSARRIRVRSTPFDNDAEDMAARRLVRQEHKKLVGGMSDLKAFS